MLRMGIVGPAVLVEDIQAVMKEFEEVEPVSLVYQSERSAPQLIQESKEIIDVFLFTGPVPYELSKGVLPPDSRSIFVPFEGTDVYDILMRIYRSYHFFPVISFDIINTCDIEEIYQEVGISHVKPYVKNMGGFGDSEELFQHHLQLWKAGKVQVIATCLHSVFVRFKSMNVPVFQVKHTRQTIRETIRKAVLMGVEQRKHLAQITVLQFHIDVADDPDHDVSSNEAYAEVKQKILEYGNTLFSGSGVFEDEILTLYTTRGILEKMTANCEEFSILREISQHDPFTLSLGIGMGNTGERADSNARKALSFARQHGGNCGFLIDDDTTVRGPLGTNHSLAYSLVHVQEKRGFVSTTLRKFYAWLITMRKKQVTAHEISIGLNTSGRHATRILKSLREKGIAAVVGKESLNLKGRPRPIFEIDLEKLEAEVKEAR